MRGQNAPRLRSRGGDFSLRKNVGVAVALPPLVRFLGIDGANNNAYDTHIMIARITRWKIVILRVVAAALVIFGLATGYYWFYYMGPLRCWYDPVWFHQHSYAASWDLCQKCIHRSGWYHDTIVGSCGDKFWVEWITNHIRPNEPISDCTAGHKDTALRQMTNQDAGNTAEAWLAWWERNKSKSQKDWIRDGFRERGLELENPPTKSNIVALLKLTPYQDEEKCGAPSYVQYNAFRWLRDSDFDPSTFTVDDLSSKDGNDVLQGLIRFSRLTGVYPKDDGVGVLDLGNPLERYFYPPAMSTPGFQLLANAIIFLPLCTGLFLFWISFRMRKRSGID